MIAALCSTIALQSGAQTADSTEVAAPDSTTIMLEGVTVSASQVIKKADRDVYVPTERIKGQSSDGLSLLRDIQIPSLYVNTIDDEVKAGTDAVQIRINGREATVRDVKALEPSSIIRVEYLDNPGLRYKGATNVVNIIVANRTTGGSLMAQTMSALGKVMNNGFASAKLNHKKSQWGLDIFGNRNNLDRLYSSSDEHFYLRSGEVNRLLEAMEGFNRSYWYWGKLYYNYLVPDKTNIYVQFQTGGGREKTFTPGLYSGTGITDSYLYDKNGSRSSYPSLNFYIDHKIGRKQTLVLNVNAGWRSENSDNDHRESASPESSDWLDSYVTDTRTRNFQFTTELNYIKEWDRYTFTAGTSYDFTRQRQEYLAPYDMVQRQRTQSLYTFAEASARYGKFNLTVGLGGTYDYYKVLGGMKDNRFSWRPRFSAAYRINDAHRLNFTFETTTGMPTMAQLSDVVTETDGFLLSSGNPNLKSYANYNTTLSYMFIKPRVSVRVRGIWWRSPASPESYIYLTDDDKIMNSYANMSTSTWRFDISPRVTVVPDWLTLSATLGFRHQSARYGKYRGILNSWSGNYSAELTHWNFTFTLMGWYGPKDLSGMSWQTYNSNTILSLSYKWKKFNFTAGVFNPWNKFRQYSGVMSPDYHKAQKFQIKSAQTVGFVAVSYNLQWGVQKKSGQRLIDAPQQEQKSSSTGL